MFNHPALLDLSGLLIKNQDRYEAHDRAKPMIKQLCHDRGFLHEVLREYLNSPNVLKTANQLMIPLVNSGDIIISINAVCGKRDGAPRVNRSTDPA